MSKKILLLLVTLSVTLSILLTFQVNWLVSSDTVLSFSKSTYTLSELSYKTKDQIKTLLGTPKKERFGKLPSGEQFEEWNYGSDSLMITFIDEKAVRFSIVPNESFSFPEQVYDALDEWDIQIDQKPTEQTDYFTKWEHPNQDYSLVTVVQKDGMIQYLNVIMK